METSKTSLHLDISKKIKSIRLEKNISESTVAQFLKISEEEYNKIESGEVKHSLDSLEKISDILNIQVTDLVLINDFNQNNYMIKKLNQYDLDDVDFLILSVLSKKLASQNKQNKILLENIKAQLQNHHKLS